MKIKTPSEFEVDKYLLRWESLENYVLQESSLTKLFTKTYPRNDDLDDVLVKVCSLNDFYSTNIFSPFKVAKHIVKLDIDERLKQKDLKLVNEIASIQISPNKSINFYSFATKYCSHHDPITYPIYDSYVDKLLMRLKKLYGFSEFKKADLKKLFEIQKKS